MAKSILEIVYKIAKQGGADRETLSDLKKIQAGMSEIAAVGGTMVAVGYSIKKAYDLAKEGAQIEMMRGRFDNLARSIGTTGDVLMNDLRTATRGLYSDAELAASATDMMGLGLAKTSEEAVRLAAVSGALNMNMNQLVLTLTNQTTMRFDALGVSVDGFDAKVAKLKATGMSADAAFKEAFLQQAEQQILKVGHAADTSAGEIMRFEAGWKNLSDNFKVGFMENTIPLIERLNELMDESGSALGVFRFGWDDIIQVLGGVPALLNTLNFGFDDLFKLIRGGKDDVEATGESFAEANVFSSETGTIYYDLAEKGKALANANRDVAASTENISRANTDMLGLVFDLQAENDSYAEKIANVKTKYSDAGVALDLYKAKKQELLTQLQDGQITQEAYTEGVRNVKTAYNDGSLAMQAQEAELAILAGEHEKASQQIAYSLLQQKMAVGGLSDAEFYSLLSIGEQWGILDETTVASAANMNAQATQMAESLNDPINQAMILNGKWRTVLDAPKSVTWTVTINTIGSFPSMGQAGGGGASNYYEYTSAGQGGSGAASNTGMDAYAQYKVGGLAEGGQWQGGFAFVGEKGFEIITPGGYILPHEVSSELVRAGVVPNRGYADGLLPAPIIQQELTNISPISALSAGGGGGMSQLMSASQLQTQTIMDLRNGISETNRLMRDLPSALSNVLVSALIQAYP